MYSVTVKIEGIESRRRSAGVLHVVVGFFMIFNAANYYRIANYKNLLPIALVLLVASISLFYGFFRRRMDLSAHYNYWLRLTQVAAFTILGFLMIGTERPNDYVGVFMFVLLCIVLMFSERRIFQETTIFFTNDGIKIPGYYRDHLVKWEELSEVIVREDFLTIFNTNKKYLQYQVTQDLSTLEVAKMNAFCKEKMEGERKKVEGESRQTLNP
ncbi:MAG: hypothetical protein J7502_13935 [Flavisolibacter sp.]|nr:hypothetical protein [Flavisolibacter sp.]